MSADFLADPRWRDAAFAAGGQSYDWVDVFLSAMWRAEWRPFEQELLDALACHAAGVDPRGIAPRDGEVQAAADAFRYEHGLISSDETIAWLERAGLAVDAWADYLVRRLLHARWRGRMDELADTMASSDLSAADVAAEGICSGAFAQFARALAGRAAIAQTCGHDPATAPDRLRIDRILSEHATWTGALDGNDARARLSRLACHERAFEDHARSAITAHALAWEVDRHRIPWTRVDLERMAFESRDAAQEAAWCVRQDRRSLTEVAIDAQRPVRDTRDLLEGLETELQDAVLSARPGELVGPIAVASRHELVCVLAKRAPDLADPLVRARAEAAVVDQAVSCAVLTHVRWPAERRGRGSFGLRAAGRRMEA